MSVLSKLKKELWALCREIIREVYGNTCYTCGKQNLSGSDFQTGHFIPKSLCSAELAYSLDNLRPQCYSCNIWKSGNWPAFEEHLKKEKGKNFPDKLKKLNQKTRGGQYGKDWYEKKIREYQNMI